MKDGFVRVGCASFPIQLGQIKENAKNIIEYVKKANEEHVKVLVFPESVSYTHLTLPTICSV